MHYIQLNRQLHCSFLIGGLINVISFICLIVFYFQSHLISRSIDKSCKCTNLQTTLKNRIVNGTILDDQDLPSLAVLTIKRTNNRSNQSYYHIFCSGAVLNRHFIMTAAHCAISNNNVYIAAGLGHRLYDQIKMSEHNIRKVIQFHISPGFAWFSDQAGKGLVTPSKDISLMELEAPFDFNDQTNIEPVCLLNIDLEYSEEDRFILAGYGYKDIEKETVTDTSYSISTQPTNPSTASFTSSIDELESTDSISHESNFTESPFNYPTSFQSEIDFNATNRTSYRILMSLSDEDDQVNRPAMSNMNLIKCRKLIKQTNPLFKYYSVDEDGILCFTNLMSSACHGDSGSPIYHLYGKKLYLAAIASQIINFETPDLKETSRTIQDCVLGTTLYTVRITAHMKWIKRIVGNEICETKNFDFMGKEFFYRWTLPFSYFTLFICSSALYAFVFILALFKSTDRIEFSQDSNDSRIASNIDSQD